MESMNMINVNVIGQMKFTCKRDSHRVFIEQKEELELSKYAPFIVKKGVDEWTGYIANKPIEVRHWVFWKKLISTGGSHSFTKIDTLEHNGKIYVLKQY